MDDSADALASNAPAPAAEAPPLSLRERQRLRTRRDLVRATIDVVEAAGLDAATIDRITQRAGTSRATLYAHFPGGRSELVGEAYRLIGHDLIQAAEHDAAQQDDWIERMCAYQRAMLALSRRRELSLFYNVTGPRSFGIGKRRGSGSQRTLDALDLELRAAVERGDVPVELDTTGVAALLVGAVREAGIDATRDPASAPHHERAFRQLVRAVAGRPLDEPPR